MNYSWSSLRTWQHSATQVRQARNTQVRRRDGVGSEADARPEGRALESRPIRDARLCFWAKHLKEKQREHLCGVHTA